MPDSGSPFRPFHPDDSAKFLAARSDGFGARLRAVLNAMALARALGEDFVIYWPSREGEKAKFHGLPPARETFSHEFAARHCVDPDSVDPKRHFAGKYLSLLQCKSMEDVLKARRILVEHYPERDGLRRRFPFLKELVGPESFQSAFAAIEFSEYLEKARRLAQRIEFDGPTVALHLRAGDVVYGQFQALSRFEDKVVPYPVAVAIADQLRSQGKRVVIFGEDEALCRHLARRCGCVLASDLAQQQALDRNQTAFFDVVLMSRCSEIYAGTSNFALLASQISGAEIYEPESIVSEETIRREFLAFLETAELALGISAMQAAFAHWNAYHRYGKVFASEERRQFLNKALAFNPGNLLYGLARAADEFLSGNVEVAAAHVRELVLREAALKAGSLAGGPKSLLFFAILEPGPSAGREAARHLSALAESGDDCALLCAFLVAGPSQKEKFGEAFLRVRSEALSVFDADVKRIGKLT